MSPLKALRSQLGKLQRLAQPYFLPLDNGASSGQFLLLVENHWRLADSDKWSVVLRVHHRSGVYGLVAPRNVGSNFLAVGVERRL